MRGPYSQTQIFPAKDFFWTFGDTWVLYQVIPSEKS